MQIIVVGCGKIGKAITAQLSEEDHNVTVIDTNAERVRAVSLSYDVMGIAGNGTDFEVLSDADIEHTDILIAVTHSDEVNLLCCVLAKRTSGCKTIARVRNPIYSRGRNYIRQVLGISMTINPEYAAAREIIKLIRFPSAIEINSFAKGRIEMFRFKVPEGSPIIGEKLRHSSFLNDDVLLCAAERGNEIIIPDGDFSAEAGDMLSVMSLPSKAISFFDKIGYRKRGGIVKSTMIIGCGEMSYYLAQMLIKSGIAVKIIEINRERCENLCSLIPQASIINGDGSDEAVLKEERLSDMDSLVTSTGIDEENIILALYAKDKVKSKVVTKISHLEFNDVVKSLNLDSVINPKYITSETILQYVRAMGNTIGSNVETLYRLMDDRVEALEFHIHDSCGLIGTQIMDMHLKNNTLIAGISRGNDFIIPGGNDSFAPGDSVIVVTTNHGFRDIGDIIEERNPLKDIGEFIGEREANR